MARRLFTVEQGIQIVDENGYAGPSLLRGSGAPGGDAGEQDDAIVGSVYMNEAAGGGLYKKIADNDVAADWEEVGNVALDELNWRNETVRAATGDVLAAGNYDPSAFTDLDGTLTDDDFAVGEYIIGTAGGTPLLFEVTAINQGVGNDEITIAAAGQPIAANDTFVVQSYLPDAPAAQEAQAIVHYDGTNLIKLSDFNWALADGINLTAGYSAANGTIAASDTVQKAISNLDGNQQDLTTLSGEAQGAVDHGTFTGAVIEDNRDTHEALQDLEDSLENVVTLTGVALDSTDLGTFPGSIIDDASDIKEALTDLEDSTSNLVTLSGEALDATDHGTFTGSTIPDNSDTHEALQALETAQEAAQTTGKVTGITTLQTVDSVLVDDFHEVEWEVVSWEEATPANKKFQKLGALHDGTASADASSSDIDVFAKKRVGSNFNVVYSVDFDGTGAAQTMRLRASSSTAGVTIEFRRNGVPVQ